MSLADQGSHLLLVEHVTSSEVSFARGDALLRRDIGEQHDIVGLSLTKLLSAANDGVSAGGGG